jgi:hypothetical protein
MILLPSSIGSKMRLWEENPVALLFFKGLELGNESPLIKGWVSAPPDCPPNETCIPESMVGTMIPLEEVLPLF